MTDLPPLHVLLVDDAQEVIESLADLLELHGCQTRTALSARQALEIHQTWPADLIITDINMPGGDGRTLASTLRASHPHLIIIALSGNLPPENWNQAETGMFDHYLVKPVHLPTLVRILGLGAD